MGGSWVRVLSPRGRRIYLVVASLLFLLSVTLLVARASRRSTHALTQPAGVANSFYYEPRKGPDKLVSHKESRGGLTWFVQVSDVHLRGDDEGEVLRFRDFVEDAVTFLSPAAVLVTGDLTNAKRHGVVVGQDPREWALYRRHVKDRLALNVSTLWLDVPGNHDNFDEVQHAHFKSGGVQTSYTDTQTGRQMVVTDGDGRNITLIPVDASLKPGIRAFNFLGHLPEREFHALNAAAKDARDRGDLVLFYGHYPTSTIVSARDLRPLLAGGTAYLCGHLHTGLGLVDPMWTRHTTGLLELELADWFHHHRYRVLAVDQGRVTWLDVTHPAWPVVMITHMEQHYTATSTVSYKVRFLVFSDEDISTVSLRLDDYIGRWTACRHLHGPLYEATQQVHTDQWGSHASDQDFINNLQVLIENSSGSKSLLRVTSQGAGFTQPRPAPLSRIVLGLNLHDVFLLVYVASVSLCVAMLVLAKCQVAFLPCFPRRLMAGLAQVAHNHSTCGHMLLFMLYPLVGPWFVGRLAGDKNGVVFMWGIFVDDTMLPGELTYPDAFFLLVTLQLPVFSLVITKKTLSLESSRGRCVRVVWWLLGAVVAVQGVCVGAWLALDSLLLNGPLRLALTIIAVSLWKRL